jgi:hypothetical protein
VTKPTVEEIRTQAIKEIPYVHGRGSQVTYQRTKRIKELMIEHGYPIEVPVTKRARQNKSTQTTYRDQRPGFDS